MTEQEKDKAAALKYFMKNPDMENIEYWAQLVIQAFLAGAQYGRKAERERILEILKSSRIKGDLNLLVLWLEEKLK